VAHVRTSDLLMRLICAFPRSALAPGRGRATAGPPGTALGPGRAGATQRRRGRTGFAPAPLVNRGRRRSRQPNLPRPVDDYGDDYGLRVGHFVVHFVAHFVVYASSHGFVGPARAAASSPGPSRPEGRCEERAQVGACADFRPPDAPHLRLSSLGAGPGTGPRYCGAGDREIRVYEYVYE